jgi:hypothetical protein
MSMPRPAEPPAPDTVDPARCPGCGGGELLLVRVIRRDRGVWRAACCIGRYDRRGRRIVRRACGWSGDAEGGRNDAPAPAAPASRGNSSTPESRRLD